MLVGMGGLGMGLGMDMSFLMSVLGFIAIARSFLPPELNDFLQKWWEKLIRPINPYCVFHIPEHDVSEMQNNLYRVVDMHLRASKLCSSANELVLTSEENEKDINYSLAGGEIVADTFEGVTVWWTHMNGLWGTDQYGNEERKEENKFTLKMRKRDRSFVMTEYITHIGETAAEHKRQLRKLYLYSNNDRFWEPHSFKHPSTFATLAMDPELKAKVQADLQAFMDGEKFFRKVGRAWKRGYLLYGPPGTGKSSMIAAMANHLKYNIYDLELTQVYNNTTLKRLLVNTTSKSIIVIEDIDCSLDLSGQRKPEKPAAVAQDNHGNAESAASSVTLSGLLNFTDGLWSCCGDERIIIFTTNHVEKLDAALLRPGRMDMHIHMSYCSFETFKALAANYLSIDAHPLYDTVRGLLEDSGALITPAQVTEFLFENKDDPTAAIEAVVARLKEKPEEPEAVAVAPAPEETKKEIVASANSEDSETAKILHNGDARATEDVTEDTKEATVAPANLENAEIAEAMGNGDVRGTEDGSEETKEEIVALAKNTENSETVENTGSVDATENGDVRVVEDNPAEVRKGETVSEYDVADESKTTDVAAPEGHGGEATKTENGVLAKENGTENGTPTKENGASVCTENGGIVKENGFLSETLRGHEVTKPVPGSPFCNSHSNGQEVHGS